jgi:hypothetical protein
VNLLVTVAPPGNRRDLTAENNEAPASFTLTANPAAQIRMFADGVQLMEGDYVSSHPSVVVRLPETGGGVAGQRTVSLFVDNTVVGTVLAKPAGGSGQAPVSPLDDPTFTLTLADGRHEIRTSLVEMNVVGPPDTLDQRTGVNVSSEYHILKLFNYPNPFRSETDFTFVLTGSAAPEEVSIRIFTIAGRKIRQITIPAGGAQVGFNRIHWDGRDNDGDEIANGVYFYQVLVAARGKSETAIEKLVKVR